MKPTAGIHTSGQLAYWHKHWEGRPEYAGWQPLYTADQLREVEQQRDELLSAAENLVRVKGRHHTEQAYKALEAAIAKAKP